MTSTIRKLRDLGSSTFQALRRKAQVVTRGESEVAPSCQIPGLRDHYRRLQLPERSGTFVEIGGFDGESWSNTSFLADQGWRGIYVEPIPEYARRLRLRHMFNRVRVEQVAVGASEGEVEISVMGSLTTMNLATEEAYRSIEWAREATASSQRLTVPIRPIGDLLERNGVRRDFELLVIDVEGAEEVIVDALIASEWRPKTIVIELVDRHGDFDDHAEIMTSHAATRQKILAADYEEFYADRINTIFQRR